MTTTATSPHDGARHDPFVLATAGALAAASVLHVAWGLKVRVPGVDNTAMAEAVAGQGALPGPAACFAVAGTLATAAALVSGRPALPAAVVVAGRAGVAVGLGGRGVLGLIGRTDLVAPGEITDRFRRWDRRVYTPLCLALAAGTVRAIWLDGRVRAGGGTRAPGRRTP